VIDLDGCPSVRGLKMFFSNAFTRAATEPRHGYQSFGGGFAPVFFVPGTLVRTWGTRPISLNVVGVSNYVTYGFLPQATVIDLDGCPTFAPAYVG
jgi:hypothetical protein